MTAQHDTREAAEAMCAGYRANESDLLAERDALVFERNNLKAALATARADALRLRRFWTWMQEASDPDADEPMTAREWIAEFEAAEAITNAALIPAQEAQHDR